MNGLALLHTVQVAIGFVLLYSSVSKMRDLSSFADGVSAYGLVPPLLVAPVSAAIVAAELLIGCSHLAGRGLQASVPAGLGLLTVFLCATVIALRRGQPVACMCFGANETEVVSGRSVFRVALLLAAELGVLISATGPLRPFDPLAHPSAYAILVGACALGGLNLAAWALELPEIRRLLESRSN